MILISLIIFIVFIITMIIVIILIHTFQEYLIFYPTYVNNFPGEIKLMNGDISCRCYSNNNDNVILYCHGNSGNITEIEDLTFDNYDIFYWDYPGFGHSRGRMTLNNFKKCSLYVYDYLITKYNIVVPYGYSFGSGIASYIAMNRNTKILILEAPYYDFNLLLFEKVSILSYISRWDIPTHKYLSYYNNPIYKLHGIYDKIIPIKHSEMLKGKLYKFPNNHINLNENKKWNLTVQHILNNCNSNNYFLIKK